MSARYSLYGMQGIEISDAARIISDSLNVKFSPRDSSYRGGEYFRYRGSEGLQISIEKHWCDEDGELAEPDFPQYSALVYVDRLDAGTEGKLDAIGLLDLLRSEVV